MDRRGIYIPEDKQVLADLFKEVADEGEKSLSDRIDQLKESAEKEPPQKVSREEFENSPEYQRRLKVAKEQRERAAFERKVAFRAAQEQNPIKGRPRRKRGRKFR